MMWQWYRVWQTVTLRGRWESKHPQWWVFILSCTTLVNHTQFCHFSTILPFAGMHNQPPQTGIQVSDRTDALCHQKSRFSGVFHHRSVSLPGGFAGGRWPGSRAATKATFDFFLADESWVRIFCVVVIPDRGMITYSNFIVGILISTGAFLPFLSIFLGWLPPARLLSVWSSHRKMPCSLDDLPSRCGQHFAMENSSN